MRIATVKHNSLLQKRKKSFDSECHCIKGIKQIDNFESNKDMDINQESVPCILYFNIRTTEPLFTSFVLLLNRGQATKDMWNIGLKNLFNKEIQEI